MADPAQLANLARQATANAGAIEHANQQLAAGGSPAEASAFDVWTHTGNALGQQARQLAADGPSVQGAVDSLPAMGAALTSPMASTTAGSAYDGAVANMESVIGDAATLFGLNPDKPAPEGALAKVGAAFGALTGIEQSLSAALSAIPTPAFPAARITDLAFGLPHVHAHPPNIVPPAPPIALPSLGPVIPIPFLSGAMRTLINALPAARCGDMGIGVWCGGYFPLYEIFLGSSSVWIEGSRAARMPVDITKHCIFTSPRPQDPPMGPTVGFLTTASPNVIIGGIPMPSLLSFAMGAALKGLFRGLGKVARVVQRTKAAQRVAARAHSAADNLLNRLGISAVSKARNRIHRALCTLTGHPVDVATGKVFTEAIDVALPGPLPLQFGRVWYSTSTRNGRLGRGWHDTYDLELAVGDDVIAARLADGRHAVFMRPGEVGTASWNGQEALWLRREADDAYVLENLAGRQHWFGPGAVAGKLAQLRQVRDPNGNAITFVTEGNALRVIIDSAGRRLPVTTDAAGRIVCIEGPHPEGPDYGSVTLVSYRYDERGNMTAVGNAQGEEVLYGYQEHLLVQEMDRNGYSFHFRYDGRDADARCIETWGDEGYYRRRLSYDDIARTTTVVDSKAGRFVYHWNEQGLVEREVDALNRATATRWDQCGNRLAVFSVGGAITAFEYDQLGRTTALVDALGGRREITYDAAGDPIAVRDEGGQIWQRLYDERRNVVATIDPLGAETRYEVDARGLPVGITDSAGHVRRLEWSIAGDLAAVTDRAGARTTFWHDALGRLVARRDASGGRSEFRWDLVGRLKAVTDELGRTTIFRHDREGNVVAEVDSLGRQRTKRFGPRGRVTTITEADGTTTHFSYTDENVLTEVRSPLGQTCRLAYDAVGRLVREERFDGLVYQYIHDQSDREMLRVGPGGQRCLTRYDALNRLIGRVYPDGSEDRFEYDPRGFLTRAFNTAADVVLSYDAAGRVVTETINGRETKSVYDELGNRTRRVSCLGREFDFAYDAEGRLRNLQGPGGVALSLRYDELGREVVRIMPGQVVRDRRFDPAGQLLDARLYTGTSDLLSVQYAYEAGGSRLRAEVRQTGTTRFSHDAVGRLREVVRSDGRAQRYEYDSAGNIAGVAQCVPGEEKGPATTIRGWRVRFDEAGRLAEKSKDGRSYRYEYDAAGQLLRATSDGASTVEFAYDALGRRIAKRRGDLTIQYYWDGDKLLGREVLDRDGLVDVVEYAFMPGDFQPLCAVGIEGACVFHCDQVGTLEAAINTAGRIIWSAEHDRPDPFGVGVTVEGLAPFRFAGQIADTEVNLHYNRFRYYDPDLGIYITPDPIGLRGGTTLYNFVPDPKAWIDPYGLSGAPYGVDPEMIPGDRAAGVLTDGGYVVNPSRQNISDLVTDTGKIGSSRMSGQYMYVVDDAGNLFLGTRAGQRMPHPTLVGGPDPKVMAAGIVDIRGGRIYSVNNASGHFKPGPESLEAAERAFRQLDESGRIFHRDFQGFRTHC